MLKLLGNLLAAPVKGPVRGFEFILNSIQDEVEAEAFDESKVQGELMQAGLRFQAGEIDDAEYQETEDALLERLNEIRRYKEGYNAEIAEGDGAAASDAPEASPGNADNDSEHHG